MHDAAEAGNLEILQELLKSGAGVCNNNIERFVCRPLVLYNNSFYPSLKSKELIPNKD